MSMPPTAKANDASPGATAMKMNPRTVGSHGGIDLLIAGTRYHQHFANALTKGATRYISRFPPNSVPIPLRNVMWTVG